MLKYYLDKTGKVIKSILFPSSEFVDTEPREGSMNPVTSGGVAESVAQQSSNLAPDYTKKTYEANSYVMHDGVLYTNPNAIGTAEDWNPAHWTQTTVAEMMAGAGGGGSGYTYREITVSMQENKYIVTGVSNRSVTVASANGNSNNPWKIFIQDDCTDAIVVIQHYRYGLKPSNIEIDRDGNSLTLYGSKGQLVGGSIVEDACGYEFEEWFNGIDGDSPCTAVIIHICGDIALLSFMAG